MACSPTSLARAAKEASRSTPIAFHVDYWDGLGWPDRFASPEHTERQRAYSRAFGASGLYTPEMIVDGSEAFVGSDRDHARDSVTRALARPATATVSLRARPSGPGAVAVDYDVKGAPAGAVLSIVVVDRSASVAVRAGENAGRTLHHTDTARALATVALAHPSGTQVVTVPPDATRDGVIAFVQEGSAGRARARGCPSSGRRALRSRGDGTTGRTRLSGRERSLSARYGHLTGRERSLSARYGHLTGRERSLSARYGHLTGRERSLSARYGHLTGRERSLSARYGHLMGREMSLSA